ncbi:hypothetical protein COCOBI_01-1040 [Coccomyxa sp. Obi]|nr:hypothetical protein COCOBI_01-1040 [Coccomyxa sp. Obi]
MSEKVLEQVQLDKTGGSPLSDHDTLWQVSLSANLKVFQEIRFMLGLHTLRFRDSALENLFRSHWDSSSRTLLTLLSVVTLSIWAVATWNVHSHCSWSRFLCRFLEALCGLVILTHTYIQCQLRMFPGWRVQELNKAYALLADLAASLMYIMLVRDTGGGLGVPGGTHDMMYGIHGWGILFLQVTTESAVHLHMLNLLAYCFMEGFLAYDFGWSAFMHGGVQYLVAVVVLCGALPLAINVTCELQSRRDFLHRIRARCSTF